MTDYDMNQAAEDFMNLSKLAEMFFGDGSPTVEDQLREELRLMDECHNRCFDL